MPTNRELSIIMRLRDHATAAFKKASTVWGRSLIRLKKIAVVAMKALAALAAIGIAAVTFAFVKGMRAAGKYMLELDRLNKITGVSTERLGRLIYAMEQEHGSRQALEKGLIALTHGLGEAAEGLASFTDAFDVLGISYRDNEGNVKTADRLMMDLADRFHQGALATEEQAAAMMLLGRRVYGDLVPFLKLGREHIKALGDQGERLGVVIGGDVVAAAKRFDDELTEIRVGIRGVFLSIKTGLLPHLENLAIWFSDNMPRIVERAKQFGEAMGIWIKNIVEAEGVWRKFAAAVAFPMVLPTGLEDVEKRLMTVRKALGHVQKDLELFRAIPWYKKAPDDTAWIDMLVIRERELLKQFNEIYDRWVELRQRRREALPEAPQMDAHVRAHKELIKRRKAMELEALAVILAEREKMGLVITEEAEKLQEALEMIGMDSLEKEIFRIEKQAAAWREYFGDRYEAGLLIAEADKERLAEIAEWEEGKLALARENYKKHCEIMKHLAKETAEGMRQAMSTFFFDAITGELETLDDYMRAFGRTMARMLAELMAQKIKLQFVEPAVGKVLGWVGDLFGLAKGGQIQQGQVQPLPYAAQEGAMVARGRAVPIIAHEGEWVGTPARLAAAGIGAGRDTAPIFNISINAIDTQSFEERLAQHPDVFEGAIVQAMMKSRTIRHITRRYL